MRRLAGNAPDSRELLLAAVEDRLAEERLTRLCARLCVAVREQRAAGARDPELAGLVDVLAQVWGAPPRWTRRLGLLRGSV